MAAKTAYLDNKTGDLIVVADNTGGHPEFSRKVPTDSTAPETVARSILRKRGYSITGRGTYAYGTTFTVK